VAPSKSLRFVIGTPCGPDLRWREAWKIDIYTIGIYATNDAKKKILHDRLPRTMFQHLSFDVTPRQGRT
jgi:hypothetical protein